MHHAVTILQAVALWPHRAHPGNWEFLHQHWLPPIPVWPGHWFPH